MMFLGSEIRLSVESVMNDCVNVSLEEEPQVVGDFQCFEYLL